MSILTWSVKPEKIPRDLYSLEVLFCMPWQHCLLLFFYIDVLSPITKNNVVKYHS